MYENELLRLLHILIEDNKNIHNIVGQSIKVTNNLLTIVNHLLKEKETSEAEKKLKKVSNSPPFLVFSFAFTVANLIAFPLNSEWVALITLALFGVDHREALGERRLKRIQEAIVFIVIAIVAVYLVFHRPKEELEELEELENSDQHDSDAHDSYQHYSYQHYSYQHYSHQQNNKQTQETDFLPSTPSTHMNNCFCEERKTNSTERTLA